jgi:DNA end-binding protein Ku
MHQREHLCTIAPQGASLMLLTLRFADEVLPGTGYKATGKISAAELAMAKQLVQSMQGKFDASRFKDTYRADLRRRIQEKIRRKQTHSLEVEESPSGERPKAQVIDLMAALRASLGKSDRAAHKRARPANGARKRA